MLIGCYLMLLPVSLSFKDLDFLGMYNMQCGDIIIQNSVASHLLYHCSTTPYETMLARLLFHVSYFMFHTPCRVVSRADHGEETLASWLAR